MLLLLPAAQLDVIGTLHRSLLGTEVKWLVGGSCGLLLQGVELSESPRDVDVYMDEEDVQTTHDALLSYATDQMQLSQTEIYRSFLSHYEIIGIQVEAVGAFSVQAMASSYKVEVSYLQRYHAANVQVNGIVIALMPLAHELLFNLLRERPDRYDAIALAMAQKEELHMPVLRALLARNHWSPGFLDHLNQLLDKHIGMNRSRIT
ncbi:hypothetical protein [Paenibacillus eucommiae]|uniref:Nucleotidyl transferase AbiEii/AbiGii toxin family protein n=1 Tax=Paenibacillus eucommiae TaxID=1355755 RepID=A0ABS4IPQ4_9BACL|nr:hypothetical protein [Paenibacillus eucommiae]MBP1988901.1 hypothetical protein [Paenibacillus eucommiae]